MLQHDFPGELSDWTGFRRHDFAIDGLSAILVEPAGAPATGRPWYWRARFFGAFPYPDLELLRRGWTVVAIDVADLYGAPEAQRRFDLLYRFMRQQGYAPRCALAGYSRGGLAAWNWTRRNLDKVAALYLDNAVCDFKSWPGGKLAGPGSAADWQKCLAAYGLSEKEAATYSGNPVDNPAEIAASGLPVLCVCGDADTVVPYPENSARLIAALRQHGGRVTEIRKPGADHHPHSLENPAPIVDFIETAFRRGR